MIGDFYVILLTFWLGLGNPRHIVTKSKQNNKITVLYGCGFGFCQTPTPSLGQNPKVCRIFFKSYSLTPSLSCFCFQHRQFLGRVGLANEGSADKNIENPSMKHKIPGLLDYHEPSPVPHAHVLPEVPLSDLDQLTLVSFLAKDVASDSLQHFTLDLPHQFYDQLVTFLTNAVELSGRLKSS